MRHEPLRRQVSPKKKSRAIIGDGSSPSILWLLRNSLDESTSLARVERHSIFSWRAAGRIPLNGYAGDATRPGVEGCVTEVCVPISRQYRTASEARAGFSPRFEPKQPLSRDRSLTERRSKVLPELIEFFELLGPANPRSGTAVYHKSVSGYKA